MPPPYGGGGIIILLFIYINWCYVVCLFCFFTVQHVCRVTILVLTIVLICLSVCLLIRVLLVECAAFSAWQINVHTKANMNSLITL